MNSTLSTYLSRHFFLTLLVIVFAAAAMFLHIMGDAVFAGLAGGALVNFRIGDVFDTWIKGRDTDDSVSRPTLPGAIR